MSPAADMQAVGLEATQVAIEAVITVMATAAMAVVVIMEAAVTMAATEAGVAGDSALVGAGLIMVIPTMATAMVTPMATVTPMVMEMRIPPGITTIQAMTR